jgi:tetratricopeptide (TPR) repeat protein
MSTTGLLAALALDKEQWEFAENLARNALKLAEQQRDQEAIGSNYARLSRAMAEQGKLNESLSYIERAITIFKQLRIPSDIKLASELKSKIEQELDRQARF